MKIEVRHGDSRAVLQEFEPGAFDAVVTDPPYALVSGANASRGFMGKTWDTGDTAFDPTFWAAVLRVMKPGAHLVAFGGTRTYHRMACAIEDAGFEVRDTLAWLYGSGFPKSHNIGKAIDREAGLVRERVRPVALPARNGDGTHALGGGWQDEPWETAAASAASAAWEGWGTALKPAFEPIILARKPFRGTVAANVLAHGTGAINVDGCRIPTDESRARMNNARTDGTSYVVQREAKFIDPGGSGRWPANLCHDGSDEVVGAFPETGASVSGQRGEQHSGRHGGFADLGPNRRTGTNGVRGHDDFGGSAARFFFSAKADAADRLGSKHPTVKPVDLMRWLVRLITPPGGLVLDPFAGSGTTGMAAAMEGMRAVLIEREAEYVADIHKRLGHMRGADAPLFSEVT